jgi:hypothetical protein
MTMSWLLLTRIMTIAITTSPISSRDVPKFPTPLCQQASSRAYLKRTDRTSARPRSPPERAQRYPRCWGDEWTCSAPVLQAGARLSLGHRRLTQVAAGDGEEPAPNFSWWQPLAWTFAIWLQRDPNVSVPRAAAARDGFVRSGGAFAA